MRWMGHVSRMREERNVYKVLMGREWILGRLAGGVEWIQPAHDRDRWRALVNIVMNLWVLAPRS
jgi:hypothetical protein